MDAAASADPLDRAFARLLRGEPTSVSAFAIPSGEFVDACRERDLVALVDARIKRAAGGPPWPAPVAHALAAAARDETALELLRQREVTHVLDALAAAGVRPLLLKGTALAYALYDHPSLRPRFDTDLMIARSQVAVVRRVMAGLGYQAPPHCDGELLFCQFPLTRTDAYGLTHAFDVHWRISTQSMFAGVMTFDALSARARPVPALGPHARMPGFADALLLACIHPVMHHRTEPRLIWLYDIHLLAGRMTPAGWDAFADEASRTKVAAVCAFQLSAARHLLRSAIPERVFDRLRDAGGHEPSAEYLDSNRAWLDDQWANLRGLPRWRDRARLLREVALPNPRYMLERAQYAPTWLAATRLPYLYCRRLLVGGWKVLAGRK
jgi:hypothetical protein